MVASAPSPLGMRTDTDRCPRPSTKGVYKPSGISSVEKLMPGAMMLKARQNPQKTYHAKPGVMATEKYCSPVSRSRTKTAAQIKAA